MKKLFHYYNKKHLLTYFLSSLTILVIAISVLSGNKRKEIEPKKLDKTAEIQKLIKKGSDLYDVSKNDSAFFYYSKAQSLCEPKIEYADGYVHSSMVMARILHQNGDYNNSETTLTKILPYLKKAGKLSFYYNVYTTFGFNCYRTSDYESSLLYHEKALKFADTPFKIVETKDNIAFIYMQQKRYKEAINLLLSLAGQKKEHESGSIDLQYSAILYNLGLCYLRTDNQKAFDYLTESLEITLKTKNDYELIGNYHALYLYYKKYNNPKLKEYYIQKTFDCASKVKSITNKINSLSELIETDREVNLKKHTLLYIKLIDSITVSKKKEKNEFSYIKYNSKKDKEENLELKTQKAEKELQLEKQKNRNIILYTIIVFVLSIILLLYFYLLKKGKKGRIEATYQSETRISKKLHDELANDVHHIIAFAENQNLLLEENREHLLKNLDDIYSRTRDISKENSSIVTDKNYLASLKELISGFNTSDINLLINGLDTISWDEVEKTKKIVIYRVLQELLQNMKKHSNASLVGITFNKTDHNIYINYTDNGKGIDIDKLVLKNGLHNIENRILAIKGEIEINSNLDKGFKVHIKFPY